MKYILLMLMLVLMSSIGFAKQPKTSEIKSVKNFELKKYLGTWYEIARLPHSFEKGLDQVTATYTLLENGKIEVLNRGFKVKKNKWKDAKGKAWVPDNNKPSDLKVSFFWPFAAAYRIIYLEEDYSLAIVTSNTFDYFWILSRTPEIDDEYYNELISKAKIWGFETDKFIKVDQRLNIKKN
jgi:apolipoprotein D and lipocalin family protein